MRQPARIQRIRLGQLASGARKIPHLPRVDHDDGQARRGQRGRGGPLQAARGFQHNQGGAEGLHLFHELHNATSIVGDGPPYPGGAHGNIQLGFGHINTNKAGRVNH